MQAARCRPAKGTRYLKLSPMANRKTSGSDGLPIEPLKLLGDGGDPGALHSTVVEYHSRCMEGEECAATTEGYHGQVAAK